MASFMPQYQQPNQALMRFMLLAMLQQRMQGGGQGRQPSDFNSLMSGFNKVRSIYNLGNDIYRNVSGSEQGLTSALGSLFADQAASSLGSAAAPSLISSYSATPSALNTIIPLYQNGVAANEAANAAYNAAANQATAEAASGTLGTLGSVASGLGGLYSMYKGGDMVLDANKVGGVKGRQGGAIGGATAGLGTGLALNALGFALGPIGWAGILAGGLLGGGLAGSRLGDKDMWKTEGKRLGKLLDKGVSIPESLQLPRQLTKGRKLKDLINPNLPADYVGVSPQYGWTNNQFANTRNEKDLRPEDIWGYSAFFEKYGNDWLGKFNEQQRREIAQKALDAGAVNEHHGTIDITWTPELDSILGATPNQKPASSQTAIPKAVRPATNTVARLSPGLYRNEYGELQRGNTIPKSPRR